MGERIVRVVDLSRYLVDPLSTNRHFSIQFSSDNWSVGSLYYFEPVTHTDWMRYVFAAERAYLLAQGKNTVNVANVLEELTYTLETLLW